jgi:predicted nucleic acid-binding protein
MNSRICIDINIALKLVLPEEDSALAQALWQTWLEAGTEIVAPLLFFFEGTSTLCTLVQRGRITVEESKIMLQALQAQRIRLLQPNDLHEQALAFALRFRQSQACDAHYLALAESLSCEFWTADRRLYQVVRDELPWVRWLSEYQPST